MGDSWRGDAYRPRGYNDNSYDYDRGPLSDRYGHDRDPPPREPRDSGGFQFRGAAQPDNHRAYGDSYRRQEQRPPDFTFRATGPPAPHFPPAAPNQYSQQTGQRRDRRGNDRGGRGGGRGRGGRGGRSRAAYARDLISKSTRAATPEQMEGMNGEGKAHFVDYVSSDEDEDAASTGGDNDEQPSTKRTKTTSTSNEATTAPKWSNPDPYTVLPPTDMSMAPKKDIVQTIRKAKVEAANKGGSANAIKENVDFISFDDFNDDVSDEPDAAVSEDGEIEEGGGVDLGFDVTPQLYREHSVGAPPPPPPDIEVPDKRELAMFSEDHQNGRRWTAVNAGQVGTIISSNKRKRGPEPHSSTAGFIVAEWVPDGSNPTPWYRPDATFTSHVGLKLHKELVDFHEFVRPYTFESECRYDLIDRIQRAVRSWRGSKDVEVRSFGSFASELYLPTADMDLVAVTPLYMRSGTKSFCQRKNDMYNLSHHLGRIAKKDTMVVIAKAKVPILKFVDEYTDLKVDISFENDSGLRAIDTFLDWKRDYPEAPQLVVIVKQLLAMRGLNEVHTGGIGGFTIICLVVSMFQLMPQEQSRSGSTHGRLGELLLNFLDLYGNKFNRHSTGITMEPPGYFNKQTDYCPARINPTGLTIIDPNRPDNDISGGSKQVEAVFKCFRGALTMIQHRLDAISKGESEDQSILGCVLGGNYSSFIRQREILRDCAARRQSQPVSKVPFVSSSSSNDITQQDRQALAASFQSFAPAPSQTPFVSSFPTSLQHNSLNYVGGTAAQVTHQHSALQSPQFNITEGVPRLTGSSADPAPLEHPLEHLPRLQPWELTRQFPPFSSKQLYWMAFYAQSNTSQASSHRPLPAQPTPPAPTARPHPQPPKHALPPRPTPRQDHGYPQQYGNAPQPASYMQPQQEDYRRPVSYNNYPPPPSDNISRSNILSHSRRVDNQLSRPRRHPQPQAQAGRMTGTPSDPPEPKKRKGRNKAKNSVTGLQGDPIDLT